MGRLTGKVALVTGGSRGIGAGIVKKLVQEGASVVFTYVNAAEKANMLQRELSVQEGNILSIKADSSETKDVEQAIQLIVEKFGRIDILVNNAGLYFGGKIDSLDTDMELIGRMWQVNVAGIAHTVRSIVPYMLPGSRIISIGSGAAARTPFAGVGDYAATKAALAAYTRSWARDLAEKNITVNIIQPGLIETDLKPSDEDLIAGMLQPVALKRFGTPAEIGNVVAFLASDDASYVTGATINVDGGWSA